MNILNWLIFKQSAGPFLEIPDEIDGLMQDRCNSIANALELRLFSTNPSKYHDLPSFQE